MIFFAKLTLLGLVLSVLLEGIIDLPGLHLDMQCQLGKKGNFRCNISDKTSILEDKKVRMGILQDGKHVIPSFVSINQSCSNCRQLKRIV